MSINMFRIMRISNNITKSFQVRNFSRCYSKSPVGNNKYAPKNIDEFNAMYSCREQELDQLLEDLKMKHILLRKEIEEMNQRMEFHQQRRDFFAQLESNRYRGDKNK